MKKSILLATMSLLFFVGLTSMISTDPPENTTCSAQCEVLVAEGIFSSRGACMGACNTCLNPSSSPSKFAVCFCLQLRDIEGFENTEFSNLGQCVKYFKNL